MHAMSNKLHDQSSPYLQQHAKNPVEWYPWGDEALALAAEQDKPILLSIGYSACHWCHVMAHESFEDQETAQLMNKHFINIKVDREERPDLDKIYQTAHYMLTSLQGGWPLTMFLSPENQLPFFGGTYFPLEAKQGMQDFKSVLHKVANFFNKNRKAIKEQNKIIENAYLELQKPPIKVDSLNSAPIDKAYEGLSQYFDSSHGGFSPAPKFPQITYLERLFQYWKTTNERNALHMVSFTLSKMAAGGIYDHVGGGFFRYAVDDKWMIPHFEKMLYDNGPLLSIYAQVYADTNEITFKHIAENIANWAIEEMQSNEGGFYSSIDADSEGHEGKYYIWDREEVQNLLTDEEYSVLADHVGLNATPNFEDKWHFYVYNPLGQVAAKHSLDEQAVFTLLESAKEKLKTHRKTRIAPNKDEKILTSWNGLMIKGMALAGRLLNRPDFVASAQKALDFIVENLWKDGRLFAKYKDGRAELTGYLDDYVFLIEGIIALLQTDFRSKDLSFAIDLTEAVINHFQDSKHGDFFFTAHDHETLVLRPKPVIDESTPAGNGIAALVIAKLGYLLGNTDYINMSESILKLYWNKIMNMPHAYNSMLHALDDVLFPPQIIILRGVADELNEWQQLCNQYYLPYRMILAIENGVQDLPGWLSEKVSSETTVAYICSGQTCMAPITSLSELQKFLET